MMIDSMLTFIMKVMMKIIAVMMMVHFSVDRY